MSQQIIFVKTEKSQVKRIDLEEIYFLEANGNYVKFQALEYFEMVRVTFENVLNCLPEGWFVQINRSFAVAVKKIQTIKGYALRLDTDPILEFTIAKTHRDSLLEQLNILASNGMEPDSELDTEDKGLI